MKIIIVIPKFAVAGAEIMAENLSYGLRDCGHEVVVISLYDYKSVITERIAQHGIKLIYLNKTTGADFKTVEQLRAIFRQEHPNVVHTHLYTLSYVYLASVGLRVRIVHTVHNVADKEVNKKKQIIQKWLFKSKRVIPVSISPIVRDSIVRLYKLEYTDVPMIFNGIDLKRVIPKENYELTSEGKVVHVGRFSEQKNHKRLVDAFELVLQEYPTCKLLLIGIGDLEEKIKDYVKMKGMSNSVEFLGLIDNVYPFMSDADIFVLSSDYEGMPITLIEAMATGLPIVATNVGGIPDVISKEKTGILTNTSLNELACGIKRFLQSKMLREKYGKAAMIESQKFSVDNMTSQYLEVYRVGFKGK